MMTVAEIQIAQVNWEGEDCAQNADGVMPVSAEVNEQQKRTDGAAFPKADRDDAPARTLRRNPLNDETRAEDDVPGPTHDFPGVNGDAERAHVREKLKRLHGANVGEEGGERRAFSIELRGTKAGKNLKTKKPETEYTPVALRAAFRCGVVFS